MKSKYFVFLGIGFELVAAVLVGIYFSEFLEKKFNSKGYITMAVLFLILVAWFIHITFLLKETKKDDPNDPPTA